MEAINQNAGIILLIIAIFFAMIVGVVVYLLISIHGKLAVQRIKFIGQFSADPDTRRMVANITLSNRSLSDVTITEIGLRNGKVNFNYTEAYKQQSNLNKDARIVVGQRDAIRFSLSAEDLAKTLIQNYKGKIILRSVYVYAMDSTGISYQGKVSDIRKLLKEIAKNGVDYLPPAFEGNSEPAKPEAKPAAKPTAPHGAPAPAPAPVSPSAPNSKTTPSPAWRAPAKTVEEVSVASDKTKKV